MVWKASSAAGIPARTVALFGIPGSAQVVPAAPLPPPGRTGVSAGFSPCPVPANRVVPSNRRVTGPGIPVREAELSCTPFPQGPTAPPAPAKPAAQVAAVRAGVVGGAAQPDPACPRKRVFPPGRRYRAQQVRTGCGSCPCSDLPHHRVVPPAPLETVVAKSVRGGEASSGPLPVQVVPSAPQETAVAKSEPGGGASSDPHPRQVVPTGRRGPAAELEAAAKGLAPGAELPVPEPPSDPAPWSCQVRRPVQVLPPGQVPRPCRVRRLVPEPQSVAAPLTAAGLFPGPVSRKRMAYPRRQAAEPELQISIHPFL